MWLKTDLHTHTALGPESFVLWSPEEVIDRAARAGYQVLSFADHNTSTFTPHLARYAQERGILLIPGCEATVEGRHVLLYNFEGRAETPRTFAEIRRSRRPETLVVAPHPFFPGSTSLREALLDHLDLFDALEYSHFYTVWLDGNRQVVRLSRQSGLPLLGNSDAHFPLQFGTTYSLVEAEPTVQGVIGAIRARRVRVISRPLTLAVFCAIALAVVLGAARQAGHTRLAALRDGLRLGPESVRPFLRRIALHRRSRDGRLRVG